MTKTPISFAKLTKILFDVVGHKFLTITTETEPKMRKTNNPYFGKVKKVVTSNVSMNFDYSTVVNNRLNKEGKEKTFVAKPRVWGERIPNTCFIMHNDAMYVELHYKSEPSSTKFFLDGNEIEKTLIQEFLQEPNSNAEHQGLDKEVILRDVKISNIKEVKINGFHYVVE